MVLGDISIVNNLGKKGTSTDITIYDRKTNDQISTFCFSNTYPDKLQSLLQSIAMSDYAILNISQLDSFLGEQIIALDIFNIKNGFILHNYNIDIEKIKNIIKKTNISNYLILDNIEELKSNIMQLQAKDNENEKKENDHNENGSITSTVSTLSTLKDSINSTNNFVYIPIDHVFDVKGVGTVILGCIKHGEIKAYDELEINPINKKITIKSIQMHDDSVNYSKKSSRVGLAIKGVTAKDISRGDIITSQGISKTIINNFKIKFIKNPYFRGEIMETQNYMINVGLQIRSVKIKKIENSELYITLEKPIAYIEKDLCIVFSPDSKTMRIIGHGIME